MSQIRFSPNLFLESQELNKFQRFIFEEGFEQLLLLNSQKFGVINNTRTGDSFTNGLVELGTNVGTIKHETLYAIDVNGKVIYKPLTDNIAVPNNSAFYWVKVSFTDSANERGLVSISNTGTVTGDGTIDFTTVFRGKPNIPSRVRFSNSTLNTQEYDISEVTNATTMILQGASFSNESSLIIVNVGSFSPDAVPTASQKDIFRYASCTMTLVAESVTDTPPALIADQEFVLARVRRSGAISNIQDKRLLNIYKTKADFTLSNAKDAANPLIGIEQIQFDHASQTRSENVVSISWSFDSNNWTVDPNTNKVTLNSGAGGKYKTTADFTNGDFDGWRCYAPDGSYSIIQTSSKTGGQINLILASLEESKYSDPTQIVNITPDFESIEIQCGPNGAGVGQNCRTFWFPINRNRNESAEFKLPVFAATAGYFIYYRYRTFNDYGIFRNLPADTVHGYTNENAGTTTYASNLITLLESPSSYENTQLGFTPVQQGGGFNQGTNKVHLGWSTDGVGIRVDIDATHLILATKDNVDNSTIENVANNFRVKDGGITAAKLATEPAWNNIVFVNGWAVSGADTPQYRLDLLGHVWLRGVLNGAAASNIKFSVLPAPTKRSLQFSARGSTSTNALLQIETNGDAKINDGALADTFFLDGLSYWTD